MAKKLKSSLGYVLFGSSGSTTELDLMIMSGLKNRGLYVIEIPFEKQFDLNDLKEKTKKCNVVFNYTTYEPLTFESIELTKTLEELGKKVINSSHSFFYQEEKWMFYLKCLESGIPTPKTYIIPRERTDHSNIRQILKKTPLVLKAIFSDEGRSVEKANDFPEFMKKLRKLALKNPGSPIIAQEYIPNPEHKTYRATLINHRLCQFIEKINKKSWKQTGCTWDDRYRNVTITKEIRQICEAASSAFGMEFCGLDLMKSGSRWYVIEANSSPSLAFITKDIPRLVQELVTFMHSECKKHG